MTPLVITSGEPAGIGPDLCLLAAQYARTRPQLVLGCPRLLSQRAQALGLTLNIHEHRLGQALAAPAAGQLDVLPIELAAPCQAGVLQPANAAYVLAQLQMASDLCLQRQAAGVMTCPVHKGVINDAGFSFSGHTEFFLAATGAQDVVMLLATQGLKVALVTTHLPLKNVAAAITAPRLEQVIRTLELGLRQDFGLHRPRILVAGLNPHAGENGHLGSEEIDIIQPCLDRLRNQGMQLIGPLPADTLFTAKYLDQADAVLAMYHDQGLPVLKYKGFGAAANISLGLPIVRTSVDHGTALDLAATGNIDLGSYQTATDLAFEIIAHRNHHASGA